MSKMEYNEILRLKRMLDEANIPVEFTVWFDGFQLRLNADIDVIECFGSYGSEEDLLEIKGALTVEEREDSSVMGYLSAEEVFKRFKYCYENNTNFYSEEI